MNTVNVKKAIPPHPAISEVQNAYVHAMGIRNGKHNLKVLHLMNY